MTILCNHTISKKNDSIWFPTQFNNNTDAERHPWCVSCGDIKNISNDQPKAMGHWMNVLSKIAYQLNLTQCQKRLIAKEIQDCEYLNDTFGTFGSAQQDIFLRIISHHCRIKKSKLNSYL